MTEIQKAIKFAECETKSLELAPEINGCEMTEVWKEQIQIWKTAISALEKQVPMKVRGMRDFCVCQRTVYPYMKYCSGCGQKLDWGDGK